MKNIFIFIPLFFSSIYIFSQSAYTIKDTIFIKHHLDQAYKYDTASIVNKYDSAIYHLNKALIISKEVNYEKHLFKIYNEYGLVLNRIGNYSQALDFYFKTLEQLDYNSKNYPNQEKYKLDYVKSYISLGLVYANMENIDKAFSYYNRALQEIDDIKGDKKENIDNIKIILYTNIGSLHMFKENYLSARLNYNKAYELNKKRKSYPKDGELAEAKIYNNLGIISQHFKEFGKAFEYYNKAVGYYKKVNNTDGLAQTYNNKASCYMEMDNYKEAIPLLEKSIELCQKSFNTKSEKIALKSLIKICSDKKDYKNAFFFSQKEASLNRDMVSQENMRQIVKMENQYQQDKLTRQEKLEQEILLTKKEKRILFHVVLIIALLFVCLILLVVYWNSKIKIKQQTLQSKNLQLEKQNLELQNTELGESIESKNKELTTYVMYLSQKNALLLSMVEKITALINSNQVHKNKLMEIRNEIKKNIDNNSWEEFEVRFQQVHENFYTRLSEVIPNLTPNEKRLCAFLRLNMTTKEIASLTLQSIGSLQMARVRLRKKLKIEREENLISFLHKL